MKQYLYVVNNSLAVLPESLFSHNYISQIVVDGNSLDSLPSNIGDEDIKHFWSSKEQFDIDPFIIFALLSNFEHSGLEKQFADLFAIMG